MKGTVYKRGNSWSWQFTSGTKRTGRKHHSKGGYPRKKDAEQALAEVLAAYGKGDKRVVAKATDMTVAEYLDGWLAACQVRAKRPLKPTTAAGYRNVIDAWIVPHIGHLRLADLDRDDLVGLYRLLRERGGRGRKVIAPAPRHVDPAKGQFTGPPTWTHEPKPLGPRSVQLVHTLLTKALSSAVANDLIPVSPVDRIPDDDRPSHTARKAAEGKHWETEHVEAFLAHTAGGRLRPLWELALATGARRGELAGLRWSDVDLDQAVIRIARNRVVAGGKVIEQTPKTTSSAREVHLGPRAVAVLRQWQSDQTFERITAESAWLGGDDPYLFTNELGEPYRPDSFGKLFARAQVGAGVPVLSFHGLRHTGASLALAAGVPLLEVSERLGHSSTTITADVYGHSLKKGRTDAANKIDAALFGAAEGAS